MKPVTPSPIHQRDITIDYLRAISIVAMIILHINPYFPKMWFSQWFVNMAQWVVPAFIFCSLAVSSPHHTQTPNDYVWFVLKRLKRLLIPYYLWLIAYFLLMVSVGHTILTFPYILYNIFLAGGIDFNWLVLLFVYITLMQPIMHKIIHRSITWSLMMLGISCFISAYYLHNRVLLWSAYRLTMFPSWVGITLALMLMLRWIRTRAWGKIMAMGLVAFVIFLSTYGYLVSHSLSVSTYNHKYPPDLFYFSYCLWTTPLAYALIRICAKFLVAHSLLSRLLTYISIHSYTIFFVHICVLLVLDRGFTRRPFSYPVFTMLTFTSTFAVVYLFHRISFLCTCAGNRGT